MVLWCETCGEKRANHRYKGKGNPPHFTPLRATSNQEVHFLRSLTYTTPYFPFLGGLLYSLIERMTEGREFGAKAPNSKLYIPHLPYPSIISSLRNLAYSPVGNRRSTPPSSSSTRSTSKKRCFSR